MDGVGSSTWVSNQTRRVASSKSLEFLSTEEPKGPHFEGKIGARSLGHFCKHREQNEATRWSLYSNRSEAPPCGSHSILTEENTEEIIAELDEGQMRGVNTLGEKTFQVVYEWKNHRISDHWPSESIPSVLRVNARPVTAVTTAKRRQSQETPVFSDGPPPEECIIWARTAYPAIPQIMSTSFLFPELVPLLKEAERNRVVRLSDRYQELNLPVPPRISEMIERKSIEKGMEASPENTTAHKIEQKGYMIKIRRTMNSVIKSIF